MCEIHHGKPWLKPITQAVVWMIHGILNDLFWLGVGQFSPHILQDSFIDNDIISATTSNIQWNLSITTTSMIKLITCDLFSIVF